MNEEDKFGPHFRQNKQDLPDFLFKFNTYY